MHVDLENRCWLASRLAINMKGGSVVRKLFHTELYSIHPDGQTDRQIHTYIQKEGSVLPFFAFPYLITTDG